MSLWRCQNEACSEDQHGRLIFDFESERPICPKCGADKNKGSQLIVKREVIHYLVIDQDGNIATAAGRRSMACDPAAKMWTGLVSAHIKGVTCPKCRQSEVFLLHQAGDIDNDAKLVAEEKNTLLGGKP